MIRVSKNAVESSFGLDPIAEDGLQVGLGLVAEPVLRPGVRRAERLLRVAGPGHAEAGAEVALEPEALLLTLRDGREEDRHRQGHNEPAR